MCTAQAGITSILSSSRMTFLGNSLKLSVILAVSMIASGCTAISGYKQHTIAAADTFIDCGALLHEPRAGGHFLLLGAGNNVKLKQSALDVLVCAQTDSTDSIYLAGPLLPVIPFFGFGGGVTPSYSEFVVINYSAGTTVNVAAEQSFEWCINPIPSDGKQYRCEKYLTGNTIEIPANSVLKLRQVFAEKAKFSVADTELEFDYKRGLYFLITG